MDQFREYLPYLPYLYLGAINLIAFILTLYDKAVSGLSYRLSPKGSSGGPRIRIPEGFLLLIALLGGSPVMFLTMLLIRHKTHKVKFMLGIPLILLLQGAAVYFFLTR